METKMNVVIIYDDHTDLLRWQDCLHWILTHLHIKFQILTVENFETPVPQPHTFYILDADMPEKDALDLADKIRQSQPSSELVFCSDRFSLTENFCTCSNQCIIYKSHMEGSLTYAIWNYLCNPRVSGDFRFRFMKKAYSIPWNEIICLSKAGNNVDVTVLNVDDPYPVHTTMKSIRKEAQDNNFVDCTSSYMINLRHIKTIDGPYVILSDHKKVPGGKRAIQHVEDARQKYLLRS